MDKDFKRMLFIVAIGNFLSSIAMNQIIPLLPFIMAEYNVEGEKIGLYSALAYGGSTFVMAIFAPIWGTLADKFGRKKMLLRASLGMSLCLFISVFLKNAESFIILRLFMGAFSGFSSACIAIIALNAPKEYANYSLAKLSSYQITGSLLGPLTGGALMHFFDFRVQFLISSILLFIIFFLILFMVKERHEVKQSINVKINNNFYSFVFKVCIATFLVQFTMNFLAPIIGLFIERISQNKELATGFCFSLAGIASAIFAPKIVKIKINEHKLIAYSSLFMAINLFLQYLCISNFYLLCVMRFLFGISFCAVMPSIYTLIKKNTPSNIGSKIYGINQSFLGLGSCVGAFCGGYFYHILDTKVFFICIASILLNALIFFRQK